MGSVLVFFFLANRVLTLTRHLPLSFQKVHDTEHISSKFIHWCVVGLSHQRLSCQMNHREEVCFLQNLAQFIQIFKVINRQAYEPSLTLGLLEESWLGRGQEVTVDFRTKVRQPNSNPAALKTSMTGKQYRTISLIIGISIAQM